MGTMKKAARLVLPLVALFAGATSSWGQSASVDLGEVVVGATADSPAALAPTATISVVDAATIKKSGAQSLADALEKDAGVFVNRSGPAGSVATLDIRGSSSSQVLVILDGQRLNSAQQGAPDLSQIPASSIASIEVLSAGASAVYGPDALGGVVVITTKKASGDRLALSFDNSAWPTALGASALVDGQHLSVSGGTRIGSAGLSFGADGTRAANAYPYGGTALRSNADLMSGSGNLGLDLPMAMGNFRARASGSYQEEGVPGQLSWATPSSREKDSALRGSLGWSSDALAGGLLSVDVQGGGSWTRLEYIDPSWPGTTDSVNANLAFRGKALLSEALDLGFGGSLSSDSTQSSEYSSLASGQPSRLSAGAYVEPSLSFGNLKFVPALRYDWSSDYPAGLSFLAGASWAASEALSLRASGGTSYRAPTFMELWYPYMSNPNLKPEHGYNAEAGMNFREGGISLDVSGFARLVQDLIVNNAFWVPENVGQAFIPGAELSASARLSAFRANFHYEFDYPLDTTGLSSPWAGTLITKLSMHRANASIGYVLGPVEGLVSARYWSAREAYALPAVTIVDASVAVQALSGLTFRLSADNLLNTVYQVNSDYPMPGFGLSAGVSYKL
ncbi:MAG TPA: TonB-dependent receptor [Rectinemataceae bacterium]|nr:TonB-dependent receptor [Rectinemataceae bacterium]